ncbi:MAG: hypothetical protein GAK35_00756 [Herbaspirillum frisingense]|uniref:DUF4412 domain-containing protein n=1 Tax=Herbaspirillum frisingense TaxID=92645 RepID=A0A7V8FZF0_9BURK|nr:MAG: hypothetical protein GAK35_00756 [Herbaspirillum frisingense]
MAQDGTAFAQSLRITHYSMQLGRDGIKRETSLSEQLYRRGDQLWIERVLPGHARQEHAGDAHGAHGEAANSHAGHRHPDLAGAPLWLRRRADGVMEVRLVERDERRVIKVDAQYYARFGIDGNWNSAFHLVDPASFAEMRAVGAPRGGLQEYERRRGDMTLRIWWDAQGAYPRKVESTDRHGLIRRETRARKQAMPPEPPWDPLAGYDEIDYGDLLD